MEQERKPKPSDVAAWCRTFDCKLNDKTATISGWSNPFATISTLDNTQSFEWSWVAVDRIMRNGRKFVS